MNPGETIESININREIVLCGLLVLAVAAVFLLSQENKNLRSLIGNAYQERKPCGCDDASELHDPEYVQRFDYTTGADNGPSATTE